MFLFSRVRRRLRTSATFLFASDGSFLNIGLESTGGIVDAAPQAPFCSGTTCTITELYDQTPNGNSMPVSHGIACLTLGG